MARRRNGFSLLELAVCVFIVGLLAALVLPALNKPRHNSRISNCQNNMAVNVGKAHLQYATINERYCGYVNSFGQDHKAVSWVVPIFEYIDRHDLANAWRGRNYEWEDANQTIPAKVLHPDWCIDLLVCPENRPADGTNSPLSYIVNGGYAGDKPPACEDEACANLEAGTGENVANGVFFDQYGPGKRGSFNPHYARSVSMEYLAQHDGASRTLMLSENVQLVTTWYTTAEDRAPLAMVWYQDALDTNGSGLETHRINHGKTLDAAGRLDFARPSSNHFHGVNVTFCDGHGKFISDSIDYRVYKQTMTSASYHSDDQNPGVYDIDWNELEW